MFIPGEQSSAAENYSENYDNGQSSNQIKNESNSFIQQQLAFLSSKLESVENNKPNQQHLTWSRKNSRKMNKKKDQNLLRAFLELHHNSDGVTVSENSPPIIDGFHKTSEIAFSSDSSTTLKTQHVKLEPESPASFEHFELKTKPSRNLTLSPTGTIIKEEVTELKVSTNVLEVYTRYPRTVSPAETIVKEEYDEINEWSNDASDFLIDDKISLRNFNFGPIPRPPRNLSPAETIIKEENVEFTFHNADVELFSPLMHSIIKREPISPEGTIIKDERANQPIEYDSNHSTECQADFLENISEKSFLSCSPSPEHKRSPIHVSKDGQRSKSINRNSTLTSSASSSVEGEKAYNCEQIYRHEPASSKTSSYKSESQLSYKRQRKEILSADASDFKNAVTNEKFRKKLSPGHDRNEHVFHGHIKQIETKYRGQQMPLHLFKMIKKEKTLIAEFVKKCLMRYYQKGKIQSKDLFSEVARTISHIFYDRYAGKTFFH